MNSPEAAAGAARPVNGPMAENAAPAVLLVEDDPTTLAFLLAITEALPARVDTARCMSEALPLAQSHRYAMWLVDANLPDGSGPELLQALREHEPSTPAMAHTAACEPARHDALLAAGFAEVVVKPVTAAQWQAAVRRHLRNAVDAAPAQTVGTAADVPLLWDDAAAATALGGNLAHVSALRQLFLAELPSQLDALRHGDAGTRQAQLHRLRASCAFVGAARLAAAVRQLHEAPQCNARLARVLDVARDSMAQGARA